MPDTPVILIDCMSYDLQQGFAKRSIQQQVDYHKVFQLVYLSIAPQYGQADQQVSQALMQN